jgi:hypothetical protein
MSTSTTKTPKPVQSNGKYTLLGFVQIAYSPNGCPRWQLIMAEPHATTPITFVTASGAASAYGTRPQAADIGKLYRVQYHCTSGGKLVADAWSKVPVPEVSDEREPAHLTQG